MDREDHIAWLRRELARHVQPCRCPDCASAMAELRFFGADVDTVPQAVERVGGVR